MKSLRPYQEYIVKETRTALRKFRAVAVQLPTGGGKSHIFASITESAYGKKRRVWICVPRNELLWQTSAHLYNRKVPHGMIKANLKESRAFHVHIISMSTIKRRIRDGKIKNFPDLIIFDENHINLDGQKYIINNLPEYTKVIGFSATQERGDGRALKRCPALDFFNENIENLKKPFHNGVYDIMVKGPSMKELIEMDYLSPFRYFSPPIEGLEDIKKRGTEYDEKELTAFFKRKAVYGKAIQHYKDIADGKPCLVYCRSVKAAEDIANQFCSAGYRFASIDGKMTDKQRARLINAVKTGEIQGLTSCDLITYGLDIPNIECVIMLRPTLSRALYFQMIGRGIRTSLGKEFCIILDHVGNLREHIEIREDQTLYDAFNVDWNFCGAEKKKKKGVSAVVLKLCPKCWEYFEGPRCPCGEVKAKKPENIQEIDGRLIEQKGPIPLDQRPWEERKDFQDRMSEAKTAYNKAVAEGKIDYGAIKELILIAEKIGRSIMWVYYSLNELNHAINVPLLTAIANIKDYKPGWIHFKKKELRSRAQKADRQEVLF